MTVFTKAGLALIVCIAYATTALPQIQSDEFNTGTLSGFWTFINPLNDAILDMTGTQARITIPPGLSHDPLQFGENKAPRIVQQIAAPGTDYGNFEVFAKFDSPLNAMYQMVGIQAIEDADTYIRAELFSDGADIYPLLWAFDGTGAPNPPAPIVGSALPNGSTPPYFLRLNRTDSTFSLYYSTNAGSGWTLGASLTHAIMVDSMGVYAANSDGTSPGTLSPAFQGLIDYFSTTDPLPVQLSSFTASLNGGNSVVLRWTTVTETNNYGFHVQKSNAEAGPYVTIENSFIPGGGTTITPRSYSFTDIATRGSWFYRLEQIDLDGTRHYSEPVQIDVVTTVKDDASVPKEFGLEQNYPNPFNPATSIVYNVPSASRVVIEVFNLIGQKVMTLVDAVQPAGRHTIRFNAGMLTSGVYLYKMSADNKTFLRKMVLSK
jgi:hypothetical protein